jgi:hypothetical protein
MDTIDSTINWSFSSWTDFNFSPDLISGLIDPVSLVYRGGIAIGICAPLITAVFLCRVYARAVIARAWGVEDCMKSALCGLLY